MKLTPLQLEIQKLGADKSLSFGCILKVDKSYWRYIDYDYSMNFEDSLVYETGKVFKEKRTVLGHPITRGRLCYLQTTKINKKYYKNKPGDDSLSTFIKNNPDHFEDIKLYFEEKSKLYNQTILERPEELNKLVRDFLLSIQ